MKRRDGSLGRSRPDKDDVCLLAVPLCLGAEEEVAAAGLEDDLLQAGLINGETVRVPRGNADLVDVEHDHLDVRALVSDDGHGRPGQSGRRQSSSGWCPETSRRQVFVRDADFPV